MKWLRWSNRQAVVIIFVVLEILGIVWVTHILNQREDTYRDTRIAELETAYGVIQANYERVSRTIFSEVIDQPEVLRLMAAANQAEETTQAEIREELYQLLLPTYENLKAENFKQLHFHLPDNTSFLRFHSPEIFGDDISAVRYSVAKANRDLEPVYGFEEGRIYNGFRYVFPLFLEDEHIGSVELSLSFKAIESEMEAIFPLDFAFLIRREIVEQKVFEDQQYHYSESGLHPDYLIENQAEEDGELTGITIDLSIREQINMTLAEVVDRKMVSGEAFAQMATVEGQQYLAAFLPIRNILNEQVAYIVSYQAEETIPQYRQSYWLQVIGLTTLLSLGLVYVLSRLESAHLIDTSRKRLQAITDQMDEGLIALDRDFQIRFMNPAAYRLGDIEPGSVEGMLLSDIMVYYDDSGNLTIPDPENLMSVLAHTDNMRGEVEIKFLHNGRELPVEYTFQPMVSDGEQRYLLVFRDIFERRCAENDLRKAKEAAESGARAKSQFLAAMSHEIRTPMNAVIGMTSLLSETRLSAEQSEYVETIRVSGESLLTIINDILDFSKLDSGNLELDIHSFNLQTCVEEAIDLLAKKASEKGLELVSFIDLDVPRSASGDSTRLRQVLVNLIGNAIKFTDRGEVFVSVEKVQNKTDQVRFQVRDTGIGIPEERLGRLFKPFTQVDASITRRYGGTGLGLAICKRLVTVMGGEIGVESQPGAGSIFSFTISLPAAEKAEEDDIEVLTGALMGKHALIVDDNASNRRVISLMLRNWGITSEVFATPQSALQRLERTHFFDLAVLDYHMPEMDGVTLAKEMRACEHGKEMPLVLLSSVDDLEGLGIHQKELFSETICKPVRQSRLFDSLAVVLANAPRKTKPREKQQPARLDRNLAEKLPLRILVAEDNPVNQRLALLVLQKMGYRADAAGSGVEAIEALERQFYDIVLMDVQMPEMDGLTATREIIQRWPEAEDRPRIIAMTANAMSSDHKDCLLAGMDDYLSKPIRLEQVQNMLEKWGDVRLPQLSIEKQGAQMLDWNTVLDVEIISALHAMGADAFTSLRSLFVEEGGECLAGLQDAVNEGALEKAARLAHSLKGSGLNMGAQELAEAARELEMAARESRSGDLQGLLDELQEQFGRTCLALEAMN